MSEPAISDLYAVGLERHLTLARTITDAEAETPTKACPGWRVRDVYAHLSGACTDVLEGRVEGAGTDEWTGRQVAERREWPFSKIVDELAERGPGIVEVLRQFTEVRLPIDQWSHEQDVRGALERPGSRDEPVVAWALELMMQGRDKQRRKEGGPALRIEGTSGTWALGDGDPAATIVTNDFELMRAFLGRRSPTQVRSWMQPGGDPAATEGLAVFGPRTDDLVE